MKVFFWGTGQNAEKAWKEINENPDKFTDDYMAFVDNNSKQWGGHFHGRKIIAPTELKKSEVDYVVIISMYVEAISSQLETELQFPKEKIYTFEEYRHQCYCAKMYRNRYASICVENLQPIFNLDKLVIYTAITGGYDELREPLYVAGNIKYVCFTNNPDLKSDIWEIRYVADSNIDNVHLARHIKLNPHLFFPEYHTSVWVDGKFQITNDLREYITTYQQKSLILCFPHFRRECICDEAGACIYLNRGNKKDMIIQVANYLLDGYPVNNGLFETGCIVRAHNDPRVKELMEAWEQEVMQYSIRDQLSFPYVCWKKKFEPDICNLFINHNRWLRICGHKPS